MIKILLVDDDQLTLALLENAVVENGYAVETATNGKEALEKLREGDIRIVVSDWDMPELDGIELCRRIRARQSSSYTYVVLLTSHSQPSDIVTGLGAGADDFLVKPFNPAELAVRLKGAERVLSLESRSLTIFALAKLAEKRDCETGLHLERMREFARILAQQLAQREKFREMIDSEYIETIYLTTPLHDIGKVAIPDSILLKPGGLTEDEFAVMKTHATIGAETLASVMHECPEVGFLRMAHDIAIAHHERYDGGGYPRGLAGDDIPLSARIAAVADVYDALTSDRVYRAAMTHREAQAIITQGAGGHFDPDVVDAFIEAEDELCATRRQLHPEVADAPPAPEIELLAV